MVIFTLKKMLRNKWMVACLLIGSVVFVAVLSSIPTYTNGIFRHMLIRDLQIQQTADKIYPGSYSFYFEIKDRHDEIGENYSVAKDFTERVSGRYAPEIGLPVLSSRSQYALDRFFYHTRDRGDVKLAAILGLEGFENHAEIVLGRMPSSDPASDVMEFVMSKSDYQRSDIRLDMPFDLHTYAIAGSYKYYGKAMCVGVFTVNSDDPYWYSDTGFASPTFVIDYSYMKSRFVDAETNYLRSLIMYYAFDFSAIRTEDVRPVLSAINRQRAEVFDYQVYIRLNMEQTLRNYQSRKNFLEIMLWVLEIPVIIMLVFYIYMVSRLMIHHESNEISVLKSRGARTFQIFSVYALQSGIIAVTALVAGPPLGLLICRVLGLSNGFMELVRRRPLPLELSGASYGYAALAAAGFMVVMLVPAIGACRDTIVESKRKKSRRTSAPFWQRFYLDVLLIAISLYGLRMYHTSSQVRALSNAGGVDAPIDPLLLTASSIFVLGAGLVFLRIFPLLVALIYHAGKRVWAPPLYSTLLSIVRFRGNSQFLSLFLVFNIGLGLFNATTARTLNRFLEERIRYENGADIVITQQWPQETVTFRANLSHDESDVTFEQGNFSTGPETAMPGSPPSNDVILTRIQVKEPPFDAFMRLEGVKDATRVFRRDGVQISSGANSSQADIIGIVPHEFGRIAWFRSDLLPLHLNSYLNVLTADSAAVLLSASMRDNHGFRIGDHVRIGWRDQSNTMDCIVYGFVDYWPSVNPVAEGGAGANFIIANLTSIHRQMRMEPYSVWLRLEENASSGALYESINEAQMRVSKLRDTRQELVAVKNDPLLQGMNGTLTLGFIVTLGITFIGFLIYWILSIRSRQLQFGILRAMGLPRLGLVSTLVWEQILVSGGAIAAGVGVGVLASRLFVPTLQLMYPATEQVPPFLTTASQSDYATLFWAMGGMLTVGLAILTIMVRRLKVDQVLKLGED